MEDEKASHLDYRRMNGQERLKELEGKCKHEELTLERRQTGALFFPES